MIHPATLAPLRNLVLLDTTAEDDELDSGIVIPQMVVAKATTKSGVIVAIGPEANTPGWHREDGKPGKKGRAYFLTAPLGLAVGQRVVVAKYACSHIDHDGRRYYLAEANQIMAIIADS